LRTCNFKDCWGEMQYVQRKRKGKENGCVYTKRKKREGEWMCKAAGIAVGAVEDAS
jgi:hypothetical protein